MKMIQLCHVSGLASLAASVPREAGAHRRRGCLPSLRLSARREEAWAPSRALAASAPLLLPLCPVCEREGLPGTRAASRCRFPALSAWRTGVRGTVGTGRVGFSA